MAEHYKLIYFDARGAAEPIRYIFALAGAEYEDVRVDKADWPAMKPTTRWGQLPVIEVNGNQVSQSVAIARYLARKFKLAGETPMEEFRVDELLDSFGDLRPHMRPVFHEQDEAKKVELKKEFMTAHGRPFLAKLEVLKEKNGGMWLIGKNVTLADVFVANGIDYLLMCDAEVLNDFPALRKFQENFFTLPEIKKWIQTRPKTDM